jgi:ribonuclease P protein component
MDFSFGKPYKLCSKKSIDLLFSSGKKFRQFPFSVVFLESDHETPFFKILIVVPKKNIRKAHDRNYIKRCMRECVRKNKPELENQLATLNKKINFALIYTQREKPDFTAIEKGTHKALNKLIIELNENHPEI